MFNNLSSKNKCWICGSTKNLTREHKFKASEIKKIYGHQRLFVSRYDDNGLNYRRAQGSKSGVFKFDSKICNSCNSDVTQKADNTFVKFRKVIEDGQQTKEALMSVWKNPDYTKGSPTYTSLFRYFAKLLGCHLAEIEAPIPSHLSRFVGGMTNRNCIWLETRFVSEPSQISDTSLDLPVSLAAQGGLVVFCKKPTLLPIRYHSSLTLGRVQFIYFYELTYLEILHLRIAHPKFIRDCANSAMAALDSPIHEDDLVSIGLK